MSETYISVDIEASGPIPGAYSMLALGACLVSDIKETFYAELRPINSASVPAAMRVVGKSLADFVQTGSDPLTVMSDFRSWILKAQKETKPVFVGFNASFDWSFVNWYFCSYLGSNPFGVGGLDIKSYYMGLVGCLWEETRSSRMSQEFKGQATHTHNALDDAIEQAQMFEKMLKILRSHPTSGT